MGVRPDAPTIETIVPATFYEIIKNKFARKWATNFRNSRSPPEAMK
jgi:hypothetical protein